MVPCVNDTTSNMLAFRGRLFGAGGLSDVDGQFGFGSVQRQYRSVYMRLASHLGCMIWTNALGMIETPYGRHVGQSKGSRVFEMIILGIDGVGSWQVIVTAIATRSGKGLGRTAWWVLQLKNEEQSKLSNR